MPGAPPVCQDIGRERLDEFTHQWPTLRPGVRRVGTGELQVVSHHRQRAQRAGGCSLCRGAELNEAGVASDKAQDVGEATNECTSSHGADSSKSPQAGKSFAQECKNMLVNRAMGNTFWV